MTDRINGSMPRLTELLFPAAEFETETYEDRFDRLIKIQGEWVVHLEWEFDARIVNDPEELLNYVRPSAFRNHEKNASVMIQASKALFLNGHEPKKPEFSRFVEGGAYTYDREYLKLVVLSSEIIKNNCISESGVLEMVNVGKAVIIGGDSRLLAAMAELYAENAFARIQHMKNVIHAFNTFPNRKESVCKPGEVEGVLKLTVLSDNSETVSFELFDAAPAKQAMKMMRSTSHNSIAMHDFVFNGDLGCIKKERRVVKLKWSYAHAKNKSLRLAAVFEFQPEFVKKYESDVLYKFFHGWITKK